MKFIKSAKSIYNQSRAEFLCEVCGETVIKFLANGLRDKSCGSKSCKATREYLKTLTPTKKLKEKTISSKVYKDTRPYIKTAMTANTKIAVYFRDKKIAEYNSQSEAARELGIKQPSISKALRENRKHKNFTFKLIEDS